MKKYFNLSKYENKSYSEAQKAYIIIILDISIMVGLILLGFANPVIRKEGFSHIATLTIVVMEPILLISIILTQKGFKTIASHITICALIVQIWAIIYQTSGIDDIIVVTDTVAFVFPLIIFVALITEKKYTLIYTSINLVLLWAYLYYAYNTQVLAEVQCKDILADVTCAILLIGACSYMILYTNEKNYIELYDLNVNLEKKVENRTQELRTAMEELEAMNSQLNETKEQLWGEMQLAKKIQTILLPDNPHINHYEIFAYMQPADLVGGDYYDIINVNGKDWVVIGDVSGHGVSAGLIMMMVRTAIHSNINQCSEISPAELLVYINQTLRENIEKIGEGKYMTLTVLAVHEEGKFVFSGLHLDMMIYRSKWGQVELVETNGVWIGIVDDVRKIMQNDMLKIDINDIILLYTDGITEAWDNNSVKDSRTLADMFGLKKLRDIFEEYGDTSPENIKEKILKELEGFIINDDVTLVLIKRVD